MTEWIYLLTKHDDYPDPLQELAALVALDESGAPTYLKLPNGARPAGKTAEAGDVFYLCTRSTHSGLRVHAEATVKAAAEERSTPQSVIGVYGHTERHWFLPLERVVGVVEKCAPLTEEEENTFSEGQASVKKLGVPTRRAPRTIVVSTRDVTPAFAPARLSDLDCPPFRSIGLDPTAGTWESRMTTGKKAMPSVVLAWTADRAIVFEGRADHRTNSEFWERARETECSVACIDGPCDTNGLRILPDWRGWDETARGAARDGEVELTRAGVGLFWTTYATITRFRGAREWIARSLRLFDEGPAAGVDAIETHPHGAFTFLWRGAALDVPLAKKSTDAGRAARLAMLRAFVPTLDEAALPTHDCVDAAVAALVGIFHRLGLTRSFGTSAGGGRIWMPSDRVRLVVSA